MTDQAEGSPTRFQRKAKVYPLEWNEGDFAGMIVRVGPLRYGDMLDGGVTMGWNTPSTPRAEWLAGLKATSEAMASVLIDWNLDDEAGNPIPATLAGLRSIDEDQAVAIVMSWAVSVLGISVPLERPSDGGEQSLVESMPMETVSSSLAS